MIIKIKYDSSWRNSFLDGSNNEDLPKKGRTYTSASSKLNQKESTYQQRDVTKDTIMGILNRLIGDRRKLYQSRQDPNYFFLNLEKNITFEDHAQISQELVYLRNMNGSTNQNSFTGTIKSDIPLFVSPTGKLLWSILDLSIEEVCNFIIRAGHNNINSIHDSNSIIKFMNDNKLKKASVVPLTLAMTELHNIFPLVFTAAFLKAQFSKKTINILPLYCSALYIQVDRLKQAGHPVEDYLTKKGNIKGISKKGFILRDFMGPDKITGGKKLIYGNPYIYKTITKIIGQRNYMLNKATGSLDINIDIPEEEALNLIDMIDCAAVHSFVVGKKGIAYIENITF